MVEPVLLTASEWDEINKNLPEVNFVIDQVMKWPAMEWISPQDVKFDINKLKRLRLSQVRFRDAVENLRRSRYGLGQAVGVRKYYMSKSESHRDEHHAWADFSSRFYGDYVPLLLHAAGEHARVGLVELYDFKSELGRYTKKGSYRLEQTYDLFNDKQPRTAITKALSDFHNSKFREEVWLYRNDWFHGKPQRVETIFYNAPYHDSAFIEDVGLWQIAMMGVEQPPKYTWTDFIAILKNAMSDTHDFLERCVDEWNNVYNS